MPSDDCTHVSWPRFLFSILTGVVKRSMNKDITLIFECSLFVSKDQRRTAGITHTVKIYVDLSRFGHPFLQSFIRACVLSV